MIFLVATCLHKQQRNLSSPSGVGDEFLFLARCDSNSIRCRCRCCLLMTCKSTLVVPLCTDCLPAARPALSSNHGLNPRTNCELRPVFMLFLTADCFIEMFDSCWVAVWWAVAGGRADVKCKYLLFTFAARRCEKIIKSSDKRSVNMANGNAFIICMAGRSGSSCHACDLCIQ